MKKRLFFAIIPAILTLSSCGAKPSVKAEPNFQEDTLAHEEVFNQADSGFLYKGNKAYASNYDDVPYDGSRPTIGVQTYDDGTNISIRFVAAVNITGPLSDATAVWTRAMYNADGSKLKDFANKPCQKVYEEINDHGDALHITTFNGMYETHYDYFVVYTMLNISKADYANCYLNAYLTLNDGKQSKVLATKVVFDYYSSYTFEPSQRYFLRGQINGQQRDISQDADTQGDNPQNNYASFSSSLTSGDEFIIVANDVDNTRFMIYDASSLRGDVSNFAFSNVNGKFKANLTENFVLYLNKAGEVWTSIGGEYYQLFINDELSPIESEIISGYETDKAVFSNVAITNHNSTVKVKLNGGQVGDSYNIACSGYYTIGLNSSGSVFANAGDATINITVDCSNKGDVTSWGGKVFIVGDFCSWNTTDGNAIILKETGNKIWTGSVSWKYGTEYTYKVRLNNDAGTWGDADNWYPSYNLTFTPSYNNTSINIAW